MNKYPVFGYGFPKKLKIIKLDRLPSARNNPRGMPNEIAHTTIFRVSQNPNSIVGA